MSYVRISYCVKRAFVEPSTARAEIAVHARNRMKEKGSQAVAETVYRCAACGFFHIQKISQLEKERGEVM